jgi:predicted dehydrogenase
MITTHPSNRRTILQAGTTAVAANVLSRIWAGDQPRTGDQIAVGLIGAGIRGRALIKDMPAAARIVAVCDCYAPRIDEVRALIPETRFRAYSDYREMIDRANLDAVVITAPDHHHVLAAMLACRSGLDVYCEKPLSLTIGEGKALVRAVREHGRVLQVGSQQRSMEWDQFACQFVRQGGLGKVAHVEVQNWPSPLPEEALPEESIPRGLDWDLFLGQAPLRPHHWRLWLKDQREWNGARWRGWDMWRDYSGHLMTNWGAHAVDMVQWALGMDGSGPVEIEPLMDGHDGEMRTCPVAARYADGTLLQMTSPRGFYAGGFFHGELGDMKIVRNGFTAIPRELVPNRPAAALREKWLGQGFVAGPHLQNWIDCIRTRKDPVAPVEVGHRSATVCHLAGIARQLKRKLRWDPVVETFPDDAEANALIDRPRRGGWELPT